MAATGQRIHPAGSRHPDLRHAAIARRGRARPSREHDACGVGFVADAVGNALARGREMALEAVARVAHRGAASTDNSGDGAGLLPRFLTACSTATPTGWVSSFSPACRSASARSSSRASPRRSRRPCG